MKTRSHRIAEFRPMELLFAGSRSVGRESPDCGDYGNPGRFWELTSSAPTAVWRSVLVIASVICISLIAPARQICADDSPAKQFAVALEHTQHGRYEEGLEILDSLAKAKAEDIEAAALVLARAEARLAIGERDVAETLLTEAIPEHEASARLHAMLAKLHFLRGRWDLADAAVTKALKLDPDQLQARLIQCICGPSGANSNSRMTAIGGS